MNLEVDWSPLSGQHLRLTYAPLTIKNLLAHIKSSPVEGWASGLVDSTAQGDPQGSRFFPSFLHLFTWQSLYQPWDVQTFGLSMCGYITWQVTSHMVLALMERTLHHTTYTLHHTTYATAHHLHCITPLTALHTYVSHDSHDSHCLTHSCCITPLTIALLVKKFCS